MIVRDKSFKVFGPVHLRVHLGQGVFLPEGGWTVEVNTEWEKGTAGRRDLCTHLLPGAGLGAGLLRAPLCSAQQPFPKGSNPSLPGGVGAQRSNRCVTLHYTLFV